ncbi:MAG: UDP-N-acetylmuramate--L-alanine ligase [Rhizobiales bacterium]|nr:UDP-N-acetylmuramate--L-alanine ligase [Hyphomicrobiales bacterium]
MRIPPGLGPFHIIGIGGIGMSAIAEILMELGYTVQGSDQRDGANIKRLRERGARVFVGHDPVNLIGARYVVISSAVKPGNPELEAARARGIPIIRRAEMLAELMRFHSTVAVTGTHGKTTTTSMIAHLFDVGGLDATAMSGGIINDWGSNARHGKGEWMVVEADESDGTFIALPTQIGVVTNIDPEHLDYYGSVEAMQLAFKTFFNNIPFYGTCVAGIDHPVVRRLVEELGREKRRRVLTYGEADDSDLRIAGMAQQGAMMRFDAELSDRTTGGARRLGDLMIPVPGRHNVLNALAAIAVASEVGIPDARIREGLASFGGVKRRFTPTGTWNGVSFYDDYAHHPVEIAAVLSAARRATSGRVIAIMQPHRFSRLNDLFEEFCGCFGDADAVLVAPVYAAGEEPIPGRDHRTLAHAIKARGGCDAIAVESERELAPILVRYAKPGDLVIGIGAGTVTDWSHGLPTELAAMRRAAGGAA